MRYDKLFKSSNRCSLMQSVSLWCALINWLSTWTTDNNNLSQTMCCCCFFYLLRISILLRPSFCAYQVLGSIAYTRHLVCPTLYFSFAALDVQLRGKQCVRKKVKSTYKGNCFRIASYKFQHISVFNSRCSGNIYNGICTMGAFFPTRVPFYSLAPLKCFQQSLLDCVNRCTSKPTCMYQQ